MESKYYTPEISEFHVGFEFEVLRTKPEYDPYWKMKIKKTKFEVEHWTSTFANYNLILDLKERKIRVKYLNEEDIINLGFLPMKGNEERAFKTKNKDSHISISWIDKSKNFLLITDLIGQTVFAGKIKNKSELINQLQRCGIKLENNE